MVKSNKCILFKEEHFPRIQTFVKSNYKLNKYAACFFIFQCFSGSFFADLLTASIIAQDINKSAKGSIHWEFVVVRVNKRY